MLPLPVRMVYLHQNLSCKEFDTIRSTVLFSYEKLPCRYIFPTYIGYFYPTQGTEDGIRRSPFPIQLSVMEVMQKKFRISVTGIELVHFLKSLMELTVVINRRWGDRHLKFHAHPGQTILCFETALSVLPPGPK